MPDITISLSAKAEKQLRKLPIQIQRKLRKQLSLLVSNLRHPSLQVKKKEGEDLYEARIDLHYRFTFNITDEIIEIRAVGMHDTGLGKK